MIKLDKENKHLIRLMTFIPPLLGVVVFSYIVKFSHNIHVPSRLPIYQGVSSFFSLILIGFTYIKNRKAIKGYKLLPILLVIFTLPILGYFFAKMDFVFTFLMTTLSFVSSGILYLLLINGKVFYYLLYSIVNSFISPIVLMVNNYTFVLCIIILLIIFFYIYKHVKNSLYKFCFNDGGVDIMKSIFLHSPFILLPFFDFVIQSAIGLKQYGDYVLLNKYLNGGITLLFSYKQLNLMFSGDLKKIHIIIKMLIGVLLISLIGVFFKDFIIFAIMIAAYSFGVNLSSLIVRSKLMTGISFTISFVGLLFVGFYFLGITLFKFQIQKNAQIFIMIMTISTVLPSLLILKLTSINKND